MNAAVAPEHAWLRQLVGEWRSEMIEMNGTAPSEGTHTGTESVRMLGDVWLLAEGRGMMPGGGSAQMLMTLGFDATQGCYVGSWIGSMMNHFWHYRRGTLDAERRVLTLESEGPRFDGQPGSAQYRDVIELVDADTRLLHGNVQGDDGNWTRFMTARYRRAG
jgi:hypothetical protein